MSSTSSIKRQKEIRENETEDLKTSLFWKVEVRVSYFLTLKGLLMVKISTNWEWKSAELTETMFLPRINCIFKNIIMAPFEWLQFSYGEIFFSAIRLSETLLFEIVSIRIKACPSCLADLSPPQRSSVDLQLSCSVAGKSSDNSPHLS